jgi:hypothetical protein
LSVLTATLAAAVFRAVAAVVANPRASRADRSGPRSSATVSVTLPVTALSYGVVSAWAASSWVSPSLGAPAKPTPTAVKGRSARSAANIGTA